MLPTHFTTFSDRDLLHEIATKNCEAFEVLYHRFHTRLYQYILTTLRDPHTAEEVLEDVMFAAWKGAQRFEEKSEVSTWLFSIARHKIIDRVRSQQRDAAMVANVDQVVDPVDQHTSPLDKLEEESLRRFLQEALKHLSWEHQEILNFVFYQEFSYQEISRIIDIPLNTVKTRVFYAKQHLKRELEKLKYRQELS